MEDDYERYLDYSGDPEREKKELWKAVFIINVRREDSWFAANRMANHAVRYFEERWEKQDE